MIDNMRDAQNREFFISSAFYEDLETFLGEYIMSCLGACTSFTHSSLSLVLLFPFLDSN